MSKKNLRMIQTFTSPFFCYKTSNTNTKESLQSRATRHSTST
jgi:hypothetical protein